MSTLTSSVTEPPSETVPPFVRPLPPVIVTELFESFAFAILPASSSFVIPEFLIVTSPSVTKKLSVENEAMPLLAEVASSAEIVTVPLLCKILIPSSSVKVIVFPRLISEELVPSVTTIFECESFSFAMNPQVQNL